MTPITLRQYIQRLPRPSEIPRVEQRQLRRLYVDFVNGLEDEELLAEVESRVAARAELVLDFSRIESMVEEPWDEAEAVREATLPGSGKRLVIRPDTGEIDTFGPLAERFRQYMSRIGVYGSDWGFDPLDAALDEMADARTGGTFRERMIALDKVIHVVHGSGFLADMFIDETDDEPSADEFLTALSLDRLSGRRRPDVRVRGHKRTFKY